MATRFELVLVRHGHTLWNLNNRFTGWSEVPLSDIGLAEVSAAGKSIAQRNFRFDEAHISVLRRTRQALDTLLESANHPTVPVFTSWRLNERHYGALQGMEKDEIFSMFGKEQSYDWWRGYSTSPPALDRDDPRHPRFDPLYESLSPEELPSTESLEQCKARVIPYWEETLKPAICSGKRLIVVSHGNTLRSLRMHVENISPEDIEKVEIPLGVPFVYSFNQDMQFIELEWLNNTD